MCFFTNIKKEVSRLLNKIFIMGRLCADPELRHTQSGTSVVSLRLAVDRDFKNKDTGERKADFISVVAWRSTAEFIARNFSKGRMAVVVGSLQIRDWTDKEGNKRTTAEVVAENIYFADSKRSDTQQPEGNAPESSLPPEKIGFEETSDDDGELPF